MKTFTLSFLSFLSLLAAVSCMPVWQPTYKDEQFAKDYLKRYYNLKEEGRLSFESGISSVSKKLMEMQKFFGLKITGKLDADTLAMMKKPRCGVPDVVVSQYTTYGNKVKWDRNNITYRIENYTSDLPAAEVDECIEKAIRVWADVTSLKLLRIYSDIADIMISFHYRAHGDNLPFDGPGGDIAHAFAPSSGIGGDIHFDEDETFVFRSNRGADLFIVAAHEFGHALGLSHSNVVGALMAPVYMYKDPDTFVLPQDDVRGIQSIYGQNKDPPIVDACDPSLVLDAVATLRGEKLFFKNGIFWRIYPQNIPQPHIDHQYIMAIFWPNPPDSVDAAYENEQSDSVFLFKDRQVWAFRGRDQVPGYPTSISSFSFPNKVKKVNAALNDPGTGKTLFFVGRNYYSYDETTKKMDSGFPKRVNETFSGMTRKVTAALHYGGYTYLYSGRYMFQFSSSMGRMHMLHMLTNSYFLPCIYH